MRPNHRIGHLADAGDLHISRRNARKTVFVQPYRHLGPRIQADSRPGDPRCRKSAWAAPPHRPVIRRRETPASAFGDLLQGDQVFGDAGEFDTGAAPLGDGRCHRCDGRSGLPVEHRGPFTTGLRIERDHGVVPTGFVQGIYDLVPGRSREPQLESVDGHELSLLTHPPMRSHADIGRQGAEDALRGLRPTSVSTIWTSVDDSRRALPGSTHAPMRARPPSR